MEAYVYATREEADAEMSTMRRFGWTDLKVEELEQGGYVITAKRSSLATKDADRLTMRTDGYMR